VSPGVGLPSQPFSWVILLTGGLYFLMMQLSERPIRILIFNITHGRSGISFLGAMEVTQAAQLQLHGRDEDPQAFFDHVIFCTNVTYISRGWKKGSKSNVPLIASNIMILPDLTVVSTPDQQLAQLSTQKELSSAWLKLKPSFPWSHIHTLPSIENAVNVVRGIESESNGADVSVLVTGSLHLVGGLIEAASLSDVAL
jgi:folylpolyglutamate synthase